MENVLWALVLITPYLKESLNKIKKNQDLLNWSDTPFQQAPFHRNSISLLIYEAHIEHGDTTL